MNRYLILITLLIFTACAAPVTAAPTAIPSNTPPPTSTSTAIPTATITPTPTIAPTTAEIQPTPDFPSSAIVDSIFFLPPDTSDCQPPCWQNLRVGESTKADIQSVFDDVFGFDGTRNFFEDTTQLAPVWLSEVPGMQTDGYDWVTPEGDTFVIAAVIDSNTNILQGIHFASLSFDIVGMHTPKQIILRLGPPDLYYTQVDIDPSYIEIGATVNIKTILFYKEGMAFSFAPPTIVQELANEKGVHYCLNGEFRTATNFIVEPFESLESGSLSPLQEEWFNVYTLWIAGEEVFGLTPEEYGEVAFQDPPCFTFK